MKTRPTSKQPAGRSWLDRLVSGTRSWWATADEWGTTGKECVTIFAVTQAMLVPFYVGWVVFIR